MKTEAQIKALLAEYFDAQTSLSEEQQLREFLASYRGHDRQLINDRHLFGVFATEAAAKPAMEPATKPAAKPATKPAIEPATKPATKLTAGLPSKPVAKSTLKPARPALSAAVRPQRHLLHKWSIAAACVVAVGVITLLFTYDNAATHQSCAYVDGRTITDPQQILAEYDRIMSRIAINRPHPERKVSVLSKTNRALAKLHLMTDAQRPLAKLSKLEFTDTQTTK